LERERSELAFLRFFSPFVREGLELDFLRLLREDFLELGERSSELDFRSLFLDDERRDDVLERSELDFRKVLDRERNDFLLPMERSELDFGSFLSSTLSSGFEQIVQPEKDLLNSFSSSTKRVGREVDFFSFLVLLFLLLDITVFFELRTVLDVISEIASPSTMLFG